MIGEYVQDRWIVEMLREIAVEKNMAFTSWSDDWIIQLGEDATICRIIGYRFELNNSVAASISQDKVATYTLLNRHNVAAIPHTLIRTKATDINSEALKEWDSIVVKPLVGTSGHGVSRYDSQLEAIDVMSRSSIQAWAASPYVEIKVETRLIVLDGKVLSAYEKEPVLIDGLKMSNLGLGAVAVAVDPSPELVRLAISAQRALGLRVCSVDIVRLESGELYVLEVNDAVMMEHYARQSQHNRDVAVSVYRLIVDAAIA